MYANLPEPREGAEEIWMEDQVRHGDNDWFDHVKYLTNVAIELTAWQFTDCVKIKLI